MEANGSGYFVLKCWMSCTWNKHLSLQAKSTFRRSSSFPFDSSAKSMTGTAFAECWHSSSSLGLSCFYLMCLPGMVVGSFLTISWTLCTGRDLPPSWSANLNVWATTTLDGRAHNFSSMVWKGKDLCIRWCNVVESRCSIFDICVLFPI